MSLIYSKANKQNIDNAVAKARELKPRVTIDGFARFTVQGSQDDSYKVQFLKNEAGEFVVECECKGNKRGLACYHAASVSSIFKKQVADRAALSAAHPIPVEGTDGKEVTCSQCGKWMMAWAWTSHKCETEAPANFPKCGPDSLCVRCKIAPVDKEEALCDNCLGELAMDLFGLVA
jgi:hypothetical protein